MANTALVAAPTTPLISDPDQVVIANHFKSQGVTGVPLFAASFMNVSKESYPLPWLVREIAQNFIDGAGDKPRTLDGITFATENLGSGETRFTTRGEWIFQDPTSLVALSSGKVNAGSQTAGGNGIGLKQTALRFLRDFGVSRLAIEGDGWTIEYSILKREEVLSSGQRPLNEDWLVATVTPGPSRSFNSCIVETSNPEVVDNLKKMVELGVSERNPITQQLDYNSKHGGWKWIPPTTGNTDQPSAGRIFVNGQICRCAENTGPKDAPSPQKSHLPQVAKDFWGGPQGITVVLDNVQMQRSIDRPPMNVLDVTRLAWDSIIIKMTKDELIEQLKKSEPIWTHPQERQNPNYEQVAHGIIRYIVIALKANEYSADDLARDFPGKRYVAGFKGACSEADLEKIRAGGYTLVPDYLRDLGIPTVRDAFPREVSGHTPDAKLAAEAQLTAARTSGVGVPYIDLELTSFSQLGMYVRENVTSKKREFARPQQSSEGAPESVISFRPLRGIEEKHIVAPSIAARDLMMKQIMMIRSVGASALNLGAEHVFVEFPSHSASFAVDEENGNLVVRTAKNDGSTNSDGKIVIRFASEAQRDTFLRGTENTKVAEARNSLLHCIPGWRILSALPDTSAVRRLLWPTAIAAGTWLTWSASTSLAVPRSRAAPTQLGGKSIANLPKQNLDNILGESTLTNVAVPSTLPRPIGFDPETIKVLKRLTQGQGADAVADFKPIDSPSPEQEERLQILKASFERLTGVSVHNRLFAFSGTGTLGINMGQKAIGIHEGVLKTPTAFEDAMSVFCHEVAHNVSLDFSSLDPGHGPRWQNALGVLTSRVQKHLTDLLSRQAAGDSLSTEDLAVLKARERWSEIGKQ